MASQALEGLICISAQALADAGLEKGSEAFEKLDKTRAGILIGSGMGGLTVFQDGVKNLVEKGYKKITPFFIPYAITNMCAPCTPTHCPHHSTYIFYLGQRSVCLSSF
jgi:3-oxoacyl-(acyl-carrier-protein) synthase